MNDNVVRAVIHRDKVKDYFTTLDGECNMEEFLYSLKLICMLDKINAPNMEEKFKILDKLIAEGKEPKID